jgi:hypothetical protein
MNTTPQKLTLDQWEMRHQQLTKAGLEEPWYGGSITRHLLTEGDRRLRHLKFDNSEAALRLWNFLLTENQRLHKARDDGEKIIGTMKDLGTVPVLAYSLPNVRAFYPDGAWWTPCLMECTDGLLQGAEVLGIDAAFCPVRAMLPAFTTAEHFPIPDLLICSTGTVCDDFSAIAQRLERKGFPITWWEMPRRRAPEPGEPARALPGGALAPAFQIDWVRDELARVAEALGTLAGRQIDDLELTRAIRQANQVRRLLAVLRSEVYGATATPLPALEMLIAEMLAIHFCSDLHETINVLECLLTEARGRIKRGEAAVPESAVRIFWVNPVADLRAMNLLEDWGGRICGSDFMFTHALDLIPEDLPPMEALARTALADPMAGPAQDRAKRAVADCLRFGAEAVVVSRIPGASHCGYEGAVICEAIRVELGLPTMELEIPSISDSMLPTLSTRLQALIETARGRRK